jgi:putative Holliday junction resolvase
MKRILGIDYGKKYIGLAFGDIETGVAVPLDILDVSGRDGVAMICEYIKNGKYDHVVVGIDESGGDGGKEVRRFADGIRKGAGVGVEFVSEYLTSKTSDLLVKDVGGKRHDDSLAAMLIAQDFLDSL